MKICFIGHEYHLKTKSSEFFLKEFSELNITKYFVNEKDLDIIQRVESEKYDLVLCWQFDFFAAKFKKLGLNVVAIPMYDGSAGYSNQHWKDLKGVKILNFSWWLHQKCKKFDLESMYVKYFPDPTEYKQVSFESGFKGFLWQRRYNEINWRMIVSDLVLDQVESLHIHYKNDYQIPNVDLPNDLEKNTYNITTSEWFEKKSQLDDILNASNIYFAPRASEGIGMGFLEAMARGMFVIANDLPTHNEYICNWVNGVLYDRANPCFINLDSVDKIGYMARESVFRGHHNWLKSIDSMKSYLFN